MTIINVLRQSDSVHMLADGLAFNGRGDVRRDTKLAALPHLPAIIGFRGPALVGPYLTTLFDGCGSYDTLKSGISLLVQAYLPKLMDLARNDEPDFEIFVGGISETTGPDSFVMVTHDLGKHKPWAVEDLPNLSMAPLNDDMFEVIKYEFGDRGSYDRLDPALDGVRLVEIQREHWAWGQNILPGGFVQLMSLFIDGTIQTRITHRWPGCPALDIDALRLRLPPLPEAFVPQLPPLPEIQELAVPGG